jgi:hypothetical protein
MRLIAGPDDPLLPELGHAAQRHAGGSLQFAVAWVNAEGAGLLLDAVATQMSKLEATIGINNQGTTVEGMLRLLDACAGLRVLYQHPMVTFHPKAYCFDDEASGTLLVGSSNLTAGGLDTNFEASLALELTPALRDQWTTFWAGLKAHSFSIEITSESDVERLYKGGYVALEATIRAQRRRALQRTRRILEGEGDDTYDLPTEPPDRRFRATQPPVEIPFDVIEEPADIPAEEEADEAPPELPVPAGRRVFVRTLTPNDVAKLHGEQSGTFEPDLGLAARNDSPDFWGWPDAFAEVIRQLPRLERSEDVRLVSRNTGPSGVQIELVVWFREERPRHAAEFRVRPGPISTVRAAVPTDFDETSLFVIEKDNGSFVVRLVTAQDADYEEYKALLAVVRPAHRYGYGRIS